MDDILVPEHVQIEDGMEHHHDPVDTSKDFQPTQPTECHEQANVQDDDGEYTIPEEYAQNDLRQLADLGLPLHFGDTISQVHIRKATTHLQSHLNIL